MKLLTLAKLAVFTVLSVSGLKAAAPSHLALTKEQKKLVAAVIILEADGEGQKGRQAVLNVIHNRAMKKRTNYFKIVTARLQFSCINNRSHQSAIARASKSPNWNATLKMVDQSLRGFLFDVTGGATHYHTTALGRTKWSRQMKVVATIKHHIFFKEA